jgi:cysteine desulfurase/selenocysteine lyase
MTKAAAMAVALPEGRLLENRAVSFPALGRKVGGKPLIYLDSSATSLRPAEVIEAGCSFCRLHDGNPHRGLHTLSAEATDVYESTRSKVARFIHASSSDHVIYTRNATSALNLVARGLEHRLNAGDEILLTEMEHHANLVPWLTVAKRTGAKIRYISIDTTGRLDLGELDRLIRPNTKIVSVTAVSNVLGTINPIERIVSAAKKQGALTVVDAAQVVGHMPFDFSAAGADFAAFSAHKCYGPTGLGFLIGRDSALELLEPLETGGDMIEYVDFERATWAEIPRRFEAGTPNAAAAASFSRSIDFIDNLGIEKIRQHEIDIAAYALETLFDLPGLTILGPLNAADRGGLISFVDSIVHAHDLATLLDAEGIAIRAGHHCAQPLHRKLGVQSSARVSFGVYTEFSDIDALKKGILKARKVFQS